MPNTLGLDDDLDPVEAVIGIEEAFSLKISDEEAVACVTVGDIYDLLRSRFTTQIGAGGTCMSSMAFYRLRAALRSRHPDVTFGPTTSLTQYAGKNASAFLVALEKETGLRVPAANGGWLVTTGCILVLASLIPLGIGVIITQAWIAVFAAIGGFIGGATLACLDPGVLPDDCETLGGLSAKVSKLNFGRLAGAGGAVSTDGLWDAMTEVLSTWSDLPKAEIRRDTLLLAPQPKKVRA